MDGCEFKNIKENDNAVSFFNVDPPYVPTLYNRAEGFYGDSITVGKNATVIVCNSDFEMLDACRVTRHIHTYRRIECFNCTFNGRDYRTSEDIVSKIHIDEALLYDDLI